MREPDDQAANADAQQRYHRAMHAMQSAIAYELGAGTSTDTSPKHLRVGVNSALADVPALAKLLMDKGLITEREYYEAVAVGAEAELRRYEQRYPQDNFV